MPWRSSTPAELNQRARVLGGSATGLLIEHRAARDVEFELDTRISFLKAAFKFLAQLCARRNRNHHLAFLFCGLVPILPFALGWPHAITMSAAMTALVFFAIGSVRSRWSPKHWWYAGLETLLIGISAAGVAYLAGDFLRFLI